MLWGIGCGVMDDMSAAWGLGLLQLSQRQCGLVEDSNLLAFLCVLHMCVRVRTQSQCRAGGAWCVVAELCWWGGFSSKPG